MAVRRSSRLCSRSIVRGYYWHWQNGNRNHGIEYTFFFFFFHRKEQKTRKAMSFCLFAYQFHVDVLILSFELLQRPTSIFISLPFFCNGDVCRFNWTTGTRSNWNGRLEPTSKNFFWAAPTWPHQIFDLSMQMVVLLQTKLCFSYFKIKKIYI